mgnify:CR=1 FL=1
MPVLKKFVLFMSLVLGYIIVSLFNDMLENLNVYKIPAGPNMWWGLSIYPPKHTERVILCGTEYVFKENEFLQYENVKDSLVPKIYFITPTYTRSEQIGELTRLAQTLLHVKNLHWIIAEDSPKCSKNLQVLLERFGIPYTHLSSPIPEMFKTLPMYKRPRGVSGRRAAIQWILDYQKESLIRVINNNCIKIFLIKFHFWIFDN